MKSIVFILSLIALTAGFGFQALSEDKHDHAGEKEKQHAEGDGHEHGKKEAGHDEGDGHEHGKEDAEHGEGDGHGHGSEEGGHEEGGSAVGPEKGILEKSELGMKLAPEAIKTIGPETIPWKSGAFTIPYEGLVRIKETKSVFRVRGGFYKRVPATVVSRQGDKVNVLVPGLEAGDLIVITKTGFLRIAEVIAEEGASHSHAH